MNVSIHAHKFFFMRNSNDKSQTAAMTDSENFISRGRINTIGQGIIRNVLYFVFVSLNTDYIIISCLWHDYDVNDTVIKANYNPFWNWVKWDAKDLLGIPFWPFPDKLGWTFFSLPCLDAPYFHEFASFIFPREFSVRYFCIQSRSWAHICSSNQKHLFWLNKDIVSNAFWFSFYVVFELKFGGIDDNVRCVFIQLEKGFDKFWIHEVIPDHDLPEEIFEALSSLL